MIKETPAQRVERIKKEKSGLDVLEDIKRYASTTEPIDPEDIDRFKWYGLYTQNKNLQDKDDADTYFMLRVKLENASINVEQMRVISKISSEFGKNTAAFTTRQDIQFHNISVSSLPEIFERLQSVGLSTTFAAGDVPRNIVTCPVMSLDHDELIDVSDTVSTVNDYFRDNKELANLPRKYKVGISACSKHCMGHEIQDLSFTAVNVDSKVLFDVSVGGGLASNKQIAIHIGYVQQSDILTIVKAVTTIYRDEGLRESRKKARLGHLINSWGIEKFKRALENKIGFKLEKEKIQTYTPYAQREHFGVHSSKIAGTSYIGCAINGGKIGAKGLSDLADILEKNDATTIKTTSSQNFVITDAPISNTDSIVKQLALIDVYANPSPFQARMISCTGLDFCKFALSETKSQAMELATYLKKRFPDFTENVSLSINGCPNSCGHPHIVDIGFSGTTLKNNNGEKVSGFELILGGNLEGVHSSFGKKTKIKIQPHEIKGVVEKIIVSYMDSDETTIHSYLKKVVQDEELLHTLL